MTFYYRISFLWYTQKSSPYKVTTADSVEPPRTTVARTSVDVNQKGACLFNEIVFFLIIVQFPVSICEFCLEGSPSCSPMTLLILLLNLLGLPRNLIVTHSLWSHIPLHATRTARIPTTGASRTIFFGLVFWLVILIQRGMFSSPQLLCMI